jgi:hypothetical protein
MKTLIFAPMTDQLSWLKSDSQLSIYQFVNCHLLPTLTLDSFKKMLDSAIEQSNNRTICLIHSEVLLPLGPPPFLYLNSQSALNSQISPITLISQNILSERLRKRFLNCPFLFEDIEFIPLNRQNLPFKNKDMAKNFFLLLSENQRRLLRLLVRGHTTIPYPIKHDYEYLVNLNIIRKKYNRWKPISSLLEQAALDITEGLNEKLILQNNSILIGTEDITALLSPQQFKLLSLLLKNKNKTVNRDQIARALWGPLYADKYSDWAIDKLISTLRKKLSRLWINPDILVSKKKKGITISKSDN